MAELPTIVLIVVPVLEASATSSLMLVRAGEEAVLRKGLRLELMISEPLRAALALVVRLVVDVTPWRSTSAKLLAVVPGANWSVVWV